MQIDIFIAQFEDALRDELRLLGAIIERDKRRLHGV